MKQISIGQMVCVTDYNHKRCGQFGTVIHVAGCGEAGIVKLFDNRLTGVEVEQVTDATPVRW